jgi:hypothetical protein
MRKPLAVILLPSLLIVCGLAVAQTPPTATEAFNLRIRCKQMADQIEPDRQISRIRLSDKTSRLRPRHVVPKPAQAYEPKG